MSQWMCAPNMKFLSLVIPKNKGGPKISKLVTWSNPRPFIVKFSIHRNGFMQCIRPQNLKCVALSIRKFWRGSQILNLGHVTLTTPTLGGQFVVRWLVYVTVNVCTKYEVSTFGHSKDIKGVPKFRNWSRDLIHAPLGVKFSYSEKGLHAMY